MCGIFGYVGQQNNAAEIVLEGLKLLEYRGYDSWGVTVKVDKKLSVDKHVGKIGDATVDLPDSNLGIGHTRWATHGGVVTKNAHPHLDCKKEIAVIHNGIVENFAQLKKELVEKGHDFISETDTEVIVHLVEEYLKKEGFSSAVRDAFNKLSGLNAIVVANSTSKEIIAAKNGSPLVVGVAPDGFFIASDATGIAKHTKKVLFLKDNELVILGKDLQLISLPDGKKITPKLETIDWDIQESTKGTFDHYMIKEIYDQPKIIRNIATDYDEQINKLCSIIKNAKGTFLIGAGTAFHACLAATYLFSKIAHLHVNTAVASEFNYLEDFLTNKSLIVALSQSGETIDVIEPLNRAQEKGSKIVAIVNSLGSTIYRMADYKLLLGAGPEKAVASTKTYIAKLAIILMLAYGLNGGVEKGKKLLLLAADEIDRLLEKNSLDEIKKIAKILSKSEDIYTIGRGMSYPTALEGALKIKEVSYIHTEGLAGGELKHGTIALISKGTPCIVFAPDDETYEAMISNATEIKSRGGLIVGISSRNSSVFDYWIDVKTCGDADGIAQVVSAQLLGYYAALERGYDPDKPRNLAKSVTVK